MEQSTAGLREESFSRMSVMEGRKTLSCTGACFIHGISRLNRAGKRKEKQVCGHLKGRFTPPKNAHILSCPSKDLPVALVLGFQWLFCDEVRREGI